MLQPFSKRKLSVDDIIQELRKKVSKIPGIRIYLQNLGAIKVGGQLTKAMYQLTMSGADIDTLYKSSTELEKKLRDLPDLQDVNSDLQIKNLQVNVTIDREKLSRLGLTINTVQNALNSAYSARQVSVIYTPLNQYWVILEVQPQYYQDPSMLSWLRVRTPSGQLIPLSTIATVERGVGPMLVNHLGQFPSVTLSFNLKPGVSLSEAVAKVQDLAKETIPLDIAYSFQGNAQMFQSSLSNVGVLFLIAILVIYIVLGILYESFVHPLTILSGLPSAGLGALLTLLLFHSELNIYGFLGLILLIGIVKKNAIMMIDFAVEYERTNLATAEESIFHLRSQIQTDHDDYHGCASGQLANRHGARTRSVGSLTVGLDHRWRSLSITAGDTLHYPGVLYFS